MTYSNLFIPNILAHFIDRNTNGKLTKPAVEAISRASAHNAVTDLIIGKLTEEYPDYPKVGTERDYDGARDTVETGNMVVRNVAIKGDKVIFDIKFYQASTLQNETTKFFGQLGFLEYRGGSNHATELGADQFAQYGKEQPLSKTFKEKGFIQVAVRKDALLERLQLGNQAALAEKSAKEETSQGLKGRY